MPTVLAIGLDTAFVKLPHNFELTPAVVRPFIDAQLERLRVLGYEVRSCLVDLGETAEAVASRHLREQSYDCVLIGAGLRAPSRAAHIAGQGGSMLSELHNVRQIAGEPKRRWFLCDEIDLVVWEDDDEAICSFQLAYDKCHNEHCISWQKNRGLRPLRRR